MSPYTRINDLKNYEQPLQTSQNSDLSRHFSVVKNSLAKKKKKSLQNIELANHN